MDKQCKHCGNTFKPTNDNRQVFCGRSCSATFNNTGRVHSDETRRKQSVAAKASPTGFVIDQSLRGAGGSKKPKKIREQRECKECSKPFFVIRDSINKATQNRKYCSNPCSLKNKYFPNSTIRHVSIYKGFRMDSGAELAFAKMLDEAGVQWMKNRNQPFPFTDSKGKVRKYYPDFYLPDYESWVEIKGKRYIRPDDDLRLAAVGNIELIMSHELRLPACVMASVTGSAPATSGSTNRRSPD